MGFSLALTTAVFGWLFSHISAREVAEMIRAADPPRLGLFVALSLLLQTTRTLRYRVVLASADQPTGFFRLFPVVLVRGFCVDLLPARTGELVYIYLLKSRLGVELGAATASFALAFLFDLLALAPLLAGALALAGAGFTASPAALLTAGGALLAATALLIGLLPWGLRAGFGIAARAPERWRRLRTRARRFLASTHRSVVRARARGAYAPLFGLSVAVRLLKYAALYTLLLALLLPRGYTTERLPFPKVFLGLTASEMAASLPISGLAGFGAYEGAWAWVFERLGLPGDLAKQTGVSHHLLTQLWGYGLGLAALFALWAIRPRSAESAVPAEGKRRP